MESFPPRTSVSVQSSAPNITVLEVNRPGILKSLICTTLVLYAGGWPFIPSKSPIRAYMVGVSNSLRSYPSRPILFCCYCNRTPCPGTYMVVLTSRATFMMNTFNRNLIPAGSSPGLTRAPGQSLFGTYTGCSAAQIVPASQGISVNKCNRQRCATCAVIQPSRFFHSSLTNRRYTVISDCDLSCSTINVIYLISCDKCDHQYVGETKRKVSERLSGHRSSIKKRANTFIARHFTLPGHSVKDIRIQPIEHITPRPGETEKDVTIRRLDRERFWMLELATVYPYGLNDRLQHVGNVSHSNVRSGINVLNLFNRHKRRKRSHRHRRNSRRTADITLEELSNLYKAGGHGGLHRLLTTLSAFDYQFYTDCSMHASSL